MWYGITPANDCPNPVIGYSVACDGGTARLYRNGMVDACDGKEYSLSPGFSTYAELNTWIRSL